MGETNKITFRSFLPPLRLEEVAIEPEKSNPFNWSTAIVRTQEPKLGLNLNLSKIPTLFLWKRSEEETPLDLIQVPIERNGVKVFFFEEYPASKPTADTPQCDPLLGCAATFSLLRLTWR